MSRREVYLDNGATTATLPSVREAIVEALAMGPANASSVHESGEKARQLLRESRVAVAKLIGAVPDSVLFTSSGTEANNLALAAMLSADGSARRLVTTPVEHSSVMELAKHLESLGREVVYLPVDGNGVVSVDELK